MPELKHTCANDDGKRAVGMAVDPCLACDLRAVHSQLPMTMRNEHRHESRDALDRIEAALAQLESERDESETVLNRLCETLENNEDCAATAMAAMRQLAAGESPPACLTMRAELKLARSALAERKRATVAPLDLEMLEACAKLIRGLDEGGPTQSRRNRIKLLADWQRTRTAPPRGDSGG